MRAGEGTLNGSNSFTEEDVEKDAKPDDEALANWLL